MSTYAVVLPAAGRSTRFGETDRKKPFVDLAGRPVWSRALEPFLARPDVVQTVVCVSPYELAWFADEYGDLVERFRIDVVPGGEERFDTVALGLERIREEIDFVAVHDAARPLVTPELVDTVFRAAAETGAAIPGVPATSTLKRTNGDQIVETVDRSEIVLAQTPQVFGRDLLQRAYANRGTTSATDDAQLVERLGHPVRVVLGSPSNFKITTRDDLRIAESLLKPAEPPDAV